MQRPEATDTGGEIAALRQLVAIGYGEDIAVDIGGCAVAHHQVGTLIALHPLNEEFGIGNSAEVVELITILQIHHLDGEDSIECRTQHAAGYFLLRQAADPGINAIHV